MTDVEKRREVIKRINPTDFGGVSDQISKIGYYRKYHWLPLGFGIKEL